MNIGDIHFALRGITDALVVDAKRGAEEAALAGGKTFNQTFGATLKRAAGGMAGAAAGAAFGVMLTGANQLDAATRQLQADTGMTADEAKRAQDALASMYRDNLQGFDAIGAAMAKVHNDLGLTGDAADAATEKFLKFSTATGQDVSAAVASFDDILDAWNLTAADASGLMDGLIADHHKFGGVISESQAALAAMAPAMQAANMTIDDGRALLNLFNAAGIDASKAPMALAKAVKQLKPGQDLNDLIAQIGAIEDPTMRGQKAMEIFGGRGIAMSQAFKDAGMTLSDFKPTMEETTDATTKAADAIESGFGAQFQLLLKNAGGALAEFGQNFGGLLMVASAFGPAFLTKMGAAVGGIAGFFGPKLLALILPQAVATGMTSGTAMGRSFGTAFGAAAAIAIPAAILTLGIVLSAKAAADLRAQQDAIMAEGNLSRAEALAFQMSQQSEADRQTAFKRGAKRAFDNLGTTYEEALASAQPKMDAAAKASGEAAAKNLDSKIPKAIAVGVKLTAKVERIAPDEVFGLFGTSVEGVKAAALSTGIAGMEAMAAGITAARAKPVDAFTTMTEMLKNAMTPTAEAARLAGELTSDEMAAGLRSKDPAVKAQAIAVRRTIIERLEEIRKESGGIGTKAMDELNKGIRSKDPQIRSAARAAKEAVIEELEKTEPLAADAGKDAGQAFGAALAARVRAAIANMVGQSPPPEPPEPRASGGPVYAGVPYIVGEYRPELWVPEVNGRILPSVPAAFQTGQGAGAREQHINIEHVEIRDAHDEFSLIQSLRFFAAVQG